MQALHDLIKSLAKEEKRLYNLHGREGRFVDIYKAYVQAEVFTKDLDRDIYQKHFSSFSKAFYSMQKSALMDDILGVLLEYSNSSDEGFMAIKHKAKADVLRFRGMDAAALGYLEYAIQSGRAKLSPAQLLPLLEEYRDTLVHAPEVDWPSYHQISTEITETQARVLLEAPLVAARQALSVCITGYLRDKDLEAYLLQAQDSLEKILQLTSQSGPNANAAVSFQAELDFSRCFEDLITRHRRLIAAEKHYQFEGISKGLRLYIVTNLMESSMDCGDFLLINGMIYKMNKDLPALTPDERKRYLPRYLELCALYHFYENELPAAQRELAELASLAGHSEADLHRYHLCIVAFWIAANMPRNATEAIQGVFNQFPELKNNLVAKLMELMIAVEANRREEAIVLLQKMRILLRKSDDSRKLAHYRQFLELLQKLLTKKKVIWQDIPGMHEAWPQPLKANLWLKAKIENKFYYNYILDDWQSKKRILKT